MGSGTHPSWNVVQRLRLEPDTVDTTIEEVHGILRERGRDACSWEIGNSATPADLVERLYARGLVDDDDPDVIGMLLTQPPPLAPVGIEARQVRDFGEFAAASRVANVAFGMPADAGDEAGERSRYDEGVELGYWKTFVAVLDGEIVASANSTYLDGAVTLNGGAVLPEARGRGAYRALVSARWDEDGKTQVRREFVHAKGSRAVHRLERLTGGWNEREQVQIQRLVERHAFYLES